MAAIRSGAASPESTVMASFGPMPLTEISFSNSVSRPALSEPEQRDRRLRGRACGCAAALPARVRQRGEGGDRDGDVIADAAGLDDGLVRMLFEQRAAQMSDHGGERVHYFTGRNMARRRFFVDEMRKGHAEIAGEEARTCAQVLRVEEGQRYELSDNRAVYLAEIDAVRKDVVRFRVIEELAAEAPPVRLTLLLALIKFDRFEWAVEKTTELGVETIVPVEAERSEKGLDRAAGKRLERWRKIARESSQQSRRARVPEVAEPMRLAEALSEPGYFLDEEGGQPLAAALPAARAQGTACGSSSVPKAAGRRPKGGSPARPAGSRCGWGQLSCAPRPRPSAAAAVVMNAWLAAVQSGQSVGLAVETSSGPS